MTQEDIDAEKVYTSKLNVLENFIRTMTFDQDEAIRMHTDILSKIIMKNTILALWATYLQGDFEENGFDAHQFELIFQKHDNEKEPLKDLQEILNVMVTGKKNGKVPKDGPVNFFPTGFWQLPEVAWELTNQVHRIAHQQMRKVCSVHYELPADWQEEGHPEGLYISPEDQVTRLTDLLIERIREIQTATADEEASTEEEPAEIATDMLEDASDADPAKVPENEEGAQPDVEDEPTA